MRLEFIFTCRTLASNARWAGGPWSLAGRLGLNADVDRITLPDPDAPQLYEPLRKFVDTYKSTGLARFCRIPLGADPVILGLGFERFALALYDDRALLERLFDLYTSWYARAMQHICALGFDFIWSGEDIAHKSGPYLSPKMFRNLFMPYYRRVADQISKPWIFHSDGDLTLILDDLLSLGINGLHPIEPGPDGFGNVKETLCRSIVFVRSYQPGQIESRDSAGN